jgi:Cof subfamily protein (haloacid dehalogenase superfamily)
VIRLIGIDVDGTLVGSNGIVAAKIWQAATRARGAGIRLALCSGRPAFGLALDYAKELDPSGWHSFQNGASIVNLADGRSLSTSLPSPVVQQLISEARRSDRLLELYSDTEYVTESRSDWARQHAVLLGIPFIPQSFESLRGAAVRAQWLVHPAESMQIIASAPPDLEVAQSTSPLMPDTRFVGLTQKGVSKGSAMQMIAADYGFELSQVMYVGDADNDLSALQIAGCPVAMKNASPAVLHVARHVVGDVEAAGLAEAIDFAIATTTRG